MVILRDKIEDLLDSRELAKGIRKHIDILEKYGDIESLNKIGDLIKEIFKEKEINSLDKQDSTSEVISDLFRDKRN